MSARTKTLVALVCTSAAALALGSPLSGQGSCGHRDGAACGAGDHSLLQVVPRPSVSRGSGAGGSRDRKAVDLLEVRRSLETGAVNRTIANITRALKGELGDLEDFISLLALGRHKLCAAMAKNSDRVKVLMHLLKVQALLQIDAVPTMKTGEALVAAQEAESEGGRAWPQVATDDPFEKTIQSWWKPQPPKEADIVTEAVTDVVKKQEMPDNRTLSSITGDVGTEVADVERVMHDTQAEGDRLEVVSTEIADRAKILISVLEQETQQCSNGGEYSYGGLLQDGNKTHDLDKSSALQAATAYATSRLSKEELQKYLQPALKANKSITFWNLTETIRNVTTQLELDTNALVWEKNKLSVAGAEGFSHLDNLEDTMSGQHGERKPREPVLVGLQVGEKAVPAANADERPHAELQHNAPADTPAWLTPEAPKAQVPSELDDLEADVAAAPQKVVLQSNKATQLAEDVEKEQAKNVVSSSDATKTPKMPIIEDLPVTHLAFGVDNQVVSLEADVSVLAEQKRKVCWVAKTVLEHLKVILAIAESVAC